MAVPTQSLKRQNPVKKKVRKFGSGNEHRKCAAVHIFFGETRQSGLQKKNVKQYQHRNVNKERNGMHEVVLPDNLFRETDDKKVNGRPYYECQWIHDQPGLLGKVFIQQRSCNDTRNRQYKNTQIPGMVMGITVP